MVPVKIECDCGQHYAFDVEPVNGRMPTAIACPGCGADGTPAANDVIARTLTGIPAPEIPKVIAPPAPALNLHLSHGAPPTLEPAAPAPAPAPVAPSAARGGLHFAHAPQESAAPVKRHTDGPDARALGLVGRDQAQIDAQAKISWGEDPQEVIKYLMLQGFSVPEATELVNGYVQVRLADVRKNGIRSVLIGISMLFVPVIAFLLNMMMISFIVMAMCVGVGIWGFFKIIIGLVTICAPKTQSGDVAEG